MLAADEYGDAGLGGGPPAEVMHLRDELMMATRGRVAAEHRLIHVRQLLIDLRAGKPGAQRRADHYLENAQ